MKIRLRRIASGIRWVWAANENRGDVENTIYVSELGNLTTVSFRCWKLGNLTILSFENDQVFPVLPGRKGGGGEGARTAGSVPQHARFRILQTLALFVVRTQI